MKPTKAKFAVSQVVHKLLPGEPVLYATVTILERRWAGHCWYYRVAYSDRQTSWLMESQLRAPIEEVV